MPVASFKKDSIRFAIHYQPINGKLPTDKGGSEAEDTGGEKVVVASLGRYVAWSMDRVVACSIGVHSAFYEQLKIQAVWASNMRNGRVCASLCLGSFFVGFASKIKPMGHNINRSGCGCESRDIGGTKIIKQHLFHRGPFRGDW